MNLYSIEYIRFQSHLNNCALDHNVIGAVLRTKDRPEHGHDMLRRERKNMNIERYRASIAAIDWSNYYQCNDVNLLNSYLEE